MEQWQKYYTSNEISEIQKIELESLDVFTGICKQLNIDFFLYGGSMLGAVKYKGFVPWDDDLDVALIREDYELLLEKGPSLLPPGYELQEPRITPNTPYPYMKLRKQNTTMVEYLFRNVKMNHGVYFDIYPIDNLPDDDRELAENSERLLRLVRRLQQRQTPSLEAPVSGWRDLLRLLRNIAKFCLLRFIPRNRLITDMNELMTKYNGVDTARKGNMFFPAPVNYFETIYPAKDVDFEGRKMLLPCGYATNLRNRYGDIRQDPPDDKRVGHRPYRLVL